MKEVVIDNEGHLEAILDACEKGSHSNVATISNAGLGIGLARVTILPNSAFSGPPKYDKESWIKAFREVVQGQVKAYE